LRILLVEDEAAKASKIEELITQELVGKGVELLKAATINDALMQLGKGRFDLVVVDLVLPQVKGADPIDATPQWCEQIENHLSGRTASWIVMTSYPQVVDQARRSFAHHNVAVIPFDDSGIWERNLLGKLRDSYEMRPLDFVIVCALEKERRGYQYADCTLGDLEIIAGIDCQSIVIGDFRGTIAVQPSPGLISAAIVTTKALAVFKSRAVAMSGICGGIEGESELGALIVPDISWNYQRGKFKSGRLIPDPLQVPVPPTVRTGLSQMISSEHSTELRKGLMFSDLSKAPILMASMVSGSQVVADQMIGASIGQQARKVGAIDMEVASVYFAAQDFFNGGGIYFAAKAVVDLANPEKDDRYHEYGSALSARFVANALRRLLDEKTG
jgi:adenosylhomocysteine nucleosidase